MDEKEFLKRRIPDVRSWNKWRDENPRIRPDLSGADLSKANLRKVNFGSTNLSRADLSEAYLRKANLGNANLSGANLGKANLRRADLCAADLCGANLRRANLSKACLIEANLHKAILRGTNLDNTDLSGADLSNADLNKALLVETVFYGANLNNSDVYGASVWALKTDEETKQLSLVITDADEPVVTVDNLEVAQFIYLLLRHENLRKVLNSVQERGVLILGRFGGGGIEVLRAVAEKLREMEYLPIIFDFDRPRGRTYTETVKTLAGLARFVVVDLSGPSVPQELYATVPHFKIPFVPILEKGKRPYAMFADILEFDWVVKPIVEFDSTESLIQNLPLMIVNPAEKRHKKRQKLLSELFPS